MFMYFSRKREPNSVHVTDIGLLLVNLCVHRIDGNNRVFD
jgi:hypothetical protein